MVRVANGKTLTQWYKFKVTKKRATKIIIDARDMKSGGAKMNIYYGNRGKVGSSRLITGERNIYAGSYGTTYGKAMKGTYYVKVLSSKKCSGIYKIRYAE